MKQIINIIVTAMLLLGAMGVAHGQGFAPDDKRNWVLTRTPLVEVTSVGGLSNIETTQTLQYLDQWGRPEQTIQLGITPSGESLATYQEYDFMGRPNKLWAPVLGGDRAVFLPLETLKQRSEGFYEGFDAREDGATWGYALTEYENSPLSRVTGTYQPGVEAVGDPTGQIRRYGYAASSTSVKKFTATSGANDTIVNIQFTGMYSVGDLQVVENDDYYRSTYTYTDKQGRVVMVKNPAQGCTYYVYDDKSRLRAVLSPELSDRLTTTGATWNNATSVPVRQYAFLYSYDGEGNVTHKRMPGTSWTHQYYDQTGQLILSQDGNQRKKGECTFTIPDVHGRLVLQGIAKNACSLTSNPLANATVRAEWTNTTAATMGYTVKGLTLVSPDVLNVNFYDTYDFMGPQSCVASEFYDPDAVYEPKYEQEGYGKVSLPNAQGMPTGTMTAYSTDYSTIARRYGLATLYYDNRGRLIQRHSNGYTGYRMQDTECYAYNFIGQVIKKLYTRYNTNFTLTDVYSYEYDHGNRLRSVDHQLNGGTKVRLVDNSYDDLSRLKSRKVHNLTSSTLNYSHNIRNWLLGIEGDLFSTSYKYMDGNPGTYNGDISGVDYRYGLAKASYSCDLEYDYLDRLIGTSYWHAASRTNVPLGKQTYDKNGNILSLQRRNHTNTGATEPLIDDLTYTYDGNQLKAVNDAITTSPVGNGMHFKDGAKATTEYVYDANGNLTKDLNKGISNIEYNFLNLPNRIQFANGDNISYHYDTNGVKFQTTHTIGGVATRTEYSGNVIYENGVAETLLTEAGYVSLSDNKYHYYLQDHQGNNCVVIDQNGTIEEMNQYDPFGALMSSTSGSNAVQPYKYNGKELDRKAGVDWYDYGARMYDPALGRFMTQDPMAEKYYSMSPYVYCANNPVNLVDPDGKKVYYAQGVSKQFKADFAMAVQYLNKHGAGGMLADLERSDKVYYIGASSDAGSRYNPNNNTIEWNSRSGVLTTEGVTLSPTSVLNHEVDHAVQHDKNPKQQKVDGKRDESNPYKNKEEERVITGSEQRTAKKLGEIKKGEVTRKDHGGTLYEMKDPTSTEMKNEVIIKPEKK